MNSKSATIRIKDIINGTTVDGPGFRTAIYVSGCKHHCEECHNPSTWDFNAGSDYTIDEIIENIKTNDFNVTLSGGDPIYQASALLPLLKEIQKLGKSVWLYTGFVFDEIATHGDIEQLLPYIEVIVDGPFVKSLKDSSLLFRGSSNQRLVNVAHWLKTGVVKEWESDF